MHAYQLRIRGLEEPKGHAAARWQLFVCPEVRDLVKAADPERFLVLYEGEWDQHTVWCRILENAGFDAQPIGPLD